MLLDNLGGGGGGGGGAMCNCKRISRKRDLIFLIYRAVFYIPLSISWPNGIRRHLVLIKAE